ncbi:uncharacterized protein [Lepeophtheirus salmonis]|uniref:uncharacterized protein n=1 Tax=Lepeophtheirus salmonis TaxID=72036 RepID=UPI001AE7617D|nr:uncharacterized protein LOC121123664 [Lepeophtheirus salmonis]
MVIYSTFFSNKVIQNLHGSHFQKLYLKHNRMSKAYHIWILAFSISVLLQTATGFDYQAYRDLYAKAHLPTGRNNGAAGAIGSKDNLGIEESGAMTNVDQDSNSYMNSILELFGVSSGKLRSMALSLIVYLAEYITKSMFNIGDNDILKNEIPQYRSLVENEGYLAAVMQLFENSEKHAQYWVEFIEDDNLPDNLIDLLYKKTGSATNCAQMFICKTGPLITGIQQSIKSRQTFRDFSKSPQAPRSYHKNEDADMYSSFYRNLPSARTVLLNNNQCETRNIDCPMLSF